MLVHPEVPASVIELADAVGSTSQLIKAAKELPQQKLIVATKSRHLLQDAAGMPEKDGGGAHRW